MNLNEICEPIFLYVCRLNRSARKGGSYELVQVQSEIKALFGECKVKATTENLTDSWNQVELPLIFFCDSIIKQSSISWGPDWPEMARERKESDGPAKFFVLLDQALKDNSPQAPDRLAVYYSCLGLGFTGAHSGQPELLRKKMKELAARLQSAGLFDESHRICPENYEKVDTRDLVEPPVTKLLGISIALIGFIIVLFATYAFLYHDTAKSLQTALQTVTSKSTEASK